MVHELTAHLLQSSVVSPPDMPPTLSEQRTKDRHFLEQLLDTSKLEGYTVAVKIKADLRKYQQVSALGYPW